MRTSLASALLLFTLVACGDSGDAATGATTGGVTTGSTGSGGGGGDATSGSTSSATTGSGGEGGGGTPVTPGAPGTDLVNAGTVMKSPGYRMIVTIGQSSPAQQEHTSPSYSVKGGVVGATQ